MFSIASLRISLGLDTAEMETGVARAKRVSGDLAGNFAKLGGAIGGALAGIGIGSLLNDLRQMAAESIKTVDAIQDQADVLGVSTKALQELRFAAEETGVEHSSLEAGIKKLTLQMGKAADGAKLPAEAFAKLGINLRDVDGKLISTETAFSLAATALSKIESPAERAALQVRLFGSAAQNLDPLLRSGGEGIDAFRARAQSLGLVFSDDLILKAGETQRKLELIKQVADAEMAKNFVDNADAMVAYSQAISNAQIGLGNFVAGITDFVRAYPELFSTIDALITTYQSSAFIFFQQLDRDLRKLVDGGFNNASLAVEKFGVSLSNSLDNGFNAASLAVEKFGVSLSNSLDNGFNAASLAVSNGVSNIIRSISGMATQAVSFVGRMITGIQQEFGGRFNSIVASVQKRVQSVINSFAQMYDLVVGNSYVPDMIREIGEEFKRLDSVMVDPARRSVRSATEQFQQMAGEVRGIMSRLFPEVQQELDRAARIDLLRNSDLPESIRLEALRRQRILDDKERLRELDSEFDNPRATVGYEAPETIEITDQLQGLLNANDNIAVGIENNNQKIAESFVDMANIAVNSLENLTSAIKNGDFFDVANAVLDTIGKILGASGNTGQGGGGSSGGGSADGIVSAIASIFAPRGGGGGDIPEFARGGSFQVGGLSGVDANLMSINGRAVARVSRGEMVTVSPNSSGAANSNIRVEVVAGEYFDARVVRVADSRVATAAPRIAASGSQLALDRASETQRRALA